MMVRTDATRRPLRLLREKVRELFRHLPRGLAGDEDAIHDLRVAGRRLRAALPLLASKPEGRRVKRALRELRELARAAGQSRDLDVGLALLDELRQQHGSKEATVLRRRLAAVRRRQKARMAENLLDLEIAQLRRDLRQLIQQGTEALFGVLGRVRSQRDGAGKELLSSIETLGADFDAQALHAIRVQAKRLRYAAELDEALATRSGEASTALKRIQELLGLMHDAHVLSNQLRAMAARDAAAGRPALAKAALQLASRLDERAREHHSAYLQAGPADGVRRALVSIASGRPAA